MLQVASLVMFFLNLLAGRGSILYPLPNTLCFCFSKAKQLKDYENAVIAKRLEELDEDELQALQEEIERDNF